MPNQGFPCPSGSAKAARPVGQALPDRALSRSGVHYLVDALVAQPECLGDLSKRSPGGVEAPDRMLVADLSLVGPVLEVEGTISRLAGLANQPRIEGHVCLLW